MMRARKTLSFLMAAFLVLSLLPAIDVSATDEGGQSWIPGGVDTGGNYEGWVDPSCPHCGSRKFDSAGDGYVEKQPTCTEPGSFFWGYCSECGEVRDVIPPLGHDWDKLQHEYDGDCTKPGMDWHECMRCGYIGYQYAAYGDHRWADWHVMKLPTPQEDGYEERECVVCHLTEQRPLKVEAVFSMELTKGIWSTPANGLFYVEGEVIEFDFVGEIGKNSPQYAYSLVDPLFIDTIDDGVLYSPLKAGSIIDIGFYYTVTAADVEKGIIENTAYICYTDEDGNTYSHPSNTVYAPTSPEGADTLKQMTELTVEKKAVNEPEDGVCFTAGEEIEYEITVSNTTELTFSDVWVYDGLETDPLGHVTEMEPGYKNSWTYRYTVSEQDVMIRRVENVANVTCVDEQGQSKEFWSNTVIVPVYDGILGLRMDVVGLPANGAFYVPGETVRYQIEMTNPSDRSFYQVGGQCYQDAAELVVADEIAPEFTRYWQAIHVVTDADAWVGSIWNYAFAEATLSSGAVITLQSNLVAVDAGFDGDAVPPAFGVISEMEITKDCISNPANGYAYTEGETITYTITIENRGETVFGETLVFDPLFSISHELASAEHLNPGEKRTYTFSYTVTKDDVLNGCVMNTAYVTYDNAGYWESRISNTVCCMTKEGGTVVPPVVIAGPSADPGVDHCRPELKNAGDCGMEYETSFCSVHSQTCDFIDTMLQGTNDEATRQRVWVYARQMWKDELDAMYDALLKAAPPAAKAVILNERIQFNAVIGSTEAALNALYPDQPEQAAKKIAEMMMHKAAELCYEMHTAPQDRIDALSHPHGTEATGANKCTCTEEPLSDGTLRSRYALCSVHAITWQMGKLMAEDAKGSEEGWKKAGKLWLMELKMSNQKLWAGRDDKEQTALKTELQVFLNWLNARETFLNARYPDQPEIVQEALVRAMIEHTMIYCTTEK